MPAWFTLHRQPKRKIVPGPDGKTTRNDLGQPYTQVVGQAVAASAALVSKERVRSVVGARSDWQRDAWDYYDTVSELRFGITWLANACSRARLYVGRIDPDGSSEPIPVNANFEDEDFDEQGLTVQEVTNLLAPLAELGGGQLGQSEMLRRLSIHLNIPGESYLVGFDDPETSERQWLVVSADEIQSSGGGLKIQMPDVPNHQVEVDPERSTILRIWRPHPRLAYMADSPLMALRQPLRELIDLSSHITATAESRLAGAGVLFVPDELTTPAPQQSEGVNPLHADPLTAALIEAMAAPLKNRDSASAIVPLVLRGPAEAGKALQHLKFSTDFDARSKELRESAIRRVATGMDMPPEVLLGMGDSNHWSAWQVEESAIKLHVEPLLGLICDALTTNFFQPILKKMGFAAADSYAIWYDTSDLTLRPNRAPEALQAFDKGLIGASPTRREMGFSDEDAPTDEERDRALIIQIVGAAPTLAPSLLPLIGITIPETQAAAAVAEAVAEDPEAAVESGDATPALPTSTTAPRQLNPAPTTTPSTTPPGPPTQQAAGTSRKAIEGNTAWRNRCLDMAVRRALERAGNFLLSDQGRAGRAQFRDTPLSEIHLHIQVGTHQLDRALNNAYREFHAATPGEECLHNAVDNYVRALLLAREEHHLDYLDRAIAQIRCDQEAA
jgi:hypothetical protein